MTTRPLWWPGPRRCNSPHLPLSKPHGFQPRPLFQTNPTLPFARACPMPLASGRPATLVSKGLVLALPFPSFGEKRYVFEKFLAFSQNPFEILKFFWYTNCNKWLDSASFRLLGLFLSNSRPWRGDTFLLEGGPNHGRTIPKGRICPLLLQRSLSGGRHSHGHPGQRSAQRVLHPETCQQPGLHHLCPHRQPGAGRQNGPPAQPGRVGPTDPIHPRQRDPLDRGPKGPSGQLSGHHQNVRSAGPHLSGRLPLPTPTDSLRRRQEARLLR